jgi:hypothetical protein
MTTTRGTRRSPSHWPRQASRDDRVRSGRSQQEWRTCATIVSTCCLVVYLSPADKYPRLTRPTVTGAKRYSQEGSHGLPAVLCPLVTPSKPAVRTHVACAGPLPSLLPTTRLAHTPAGCGHGGTRKSNTSRRVHTRSVSPAAIAGVCGRHVLAEPVPWVGRGCGNGTQRLAWGKQKL